MGLSELEFQMVVNCHVDAENCTWVFWKNSQCFYLSIIFPVPSYSDSYNCCGAWDIPQHQSACLYPQPQGVID